jgi:hypothetical protein
MKWDKIGETNKNCYKNYKENIGRLRNASFRDRGTLLNAPGKK